MVALICMAFLTVGLCGLVVRTVVERPLVRILLWMVVSVTLVSGCERRNEAAAAVAGSGSTTAPVVAAQPPPQPTQSPLESLLAIDTLSGAIENVRPQMTDTDDDLSPGTLELGVWASRHLRWADVSVAKNETSFALVRKDSSASRGKRICMRGRIIQIQKQDLGSSTVFSGLLMAGYGNIVSFFAAGSTGELVEQSNARFCGVVIGTYDYSNSAGGKGHAVSVVGLFDLPENHETH